MHSHITLLIAPLVLSACTIFGDPDAVTFDDVSVADAGVDQGSEDTALPRDTGSDASPDAADPEDTSGTDAADTGTDTTIAALSSSGHHFCVTTTDGEASCWGRNTVGQIGNGTTEHALELAPLDTDESFVDVQAGLEHSCGLTDDGNIYCWGKRDRLGTDASEHATTPTPITSSLSYSVLAVGRAHTCALDGDGVAYCWGENDSGQLGVGDTDERGLPTEVATDISFRTLASGWNHTCGISTDGETFCWGIEGPQLGLGDVTDDVLSPRSVDTTKRFAKLDLGWNHTCAIDTQRRAHCWGHDWESSNGNGPDVDETATPRAIVGDLRFIEISAEWDYTCGVTTDADVWCWGHNQDLQSGDDAEERVVAPTRVDLPAGFDAQKVATGELSACASNDTQIACWGRGLHGRLGNGELGYEPSPIEVDPGAAARWDHVDVGTDHTCGLSQAGELYCWGRALHGRTGSADASDGDLVQVPGDWSAVTVGRRHTCGLDASSRLWCWGANGLGQIGQGDTEASYPTPLQPDGLAGTTVVEHLVEADRDRTCAVTDSDELYCWGANYFGEVGDGTTEHRLRPTLIELNDVADLALGQDHTCAATSSGSIFCWGRGDDGRLGHGDTTSQTVPTAVSTLNDVVDVAAGNRHTCAVAGSTADTVCWGNGYLGAIGGGDIPDVQTAGRTVFVQPSATRLSVGRGASCAISQGDVWCWGWSDRGMIGTGRSDRVETPQKVLQDQDIISLDVGEYHTCAVTSDGRLYCWGDLGPGSIVPERKSLHATPVVTDLPF